jgi:hypothetical protein
MIPFVLPGLSRAVPYLIVLALLIGGVVYYGHTRYNAGQANVQARWDAHSLKQNAALTQQLTENARLQNERDLIRWQHEKAVREKLAADNRSADLARRLREYYASDAHRAMSSLAESAASTAGAAGTGSGADDAGDGVDLAIQGVLTACKRDSIRLNGWQQWYESVSSP